MGSLRGCLSCLAVSSLLMSGCAFDSTDTDHRFFSDGTTEVSKRQSIEQYTATVVPIYHEYIAAIFQRTHAQPTDEATSSH